MYEDLDKFEPVVKIAVIGIGGAGNNAVNRMIDDDIDSVEFYVANTDKQSLAMSKAPYKIILGKSLTNGLGAGGNPSVGKEAAEESEEEIRTILDGKDMLFIAAGMGGGTGTGGAPVIARIAKEMGILTIAVVTRPFSFEGNQKVCYSVQGIQELADIVDSIIIVSNDKLLLMNGNLSVSNAFEESDSVLARSVKTVTDMILTPYLMNLDFADVKNTLSSSGIALIGYGSGSGENKVDEAVENAINSPLLETGIVGARKALCGITLGPNVTLTDVHNTIAKINRMACKDLDLKFALSKNPALDDSIIVSIIASDFENAKEILNSSNKPSFDPLNKDINEYNDDTNKVEEEEEEDILPDFLKE